MSGKLPANFAPGTTFAPKSVMRVAIILILLFNLATVSGQHSIWDKLLREHVSPEGQVDYQGFQKDEARLDQYLQWTSRQNPGEMKANAEKAFWINLYNAQTVKLILEHYPLKSIRNISKNGKGPWDLKLATVGDTMYTLNEIEHGILREKFHDARIHAGVNCASVSCPKLMNRAFTAENIEQLLDEAMREFINDSSKNTLSGNTVYLSKIFKWYADDFKQEGGILDYIKKFYKGNLINNPSIRYKEYDWSLNDK